MFQLRDYQTDLIDRIAAEYTQGHQRVCAVAPCGAGKTVIVGWMAGKTALLGKRVLFLVHRRELIDQASRTFAAMKIPHGIISAGMSANYEQPVQIASVQTLARRLDQVPAPDFIIIDEAHHATAGTWLNVLETYPQAMTLGVTATPRRLDGTGLEEIFDSLIIGPTVDELIGMQNLSPYDYYAPPAKADYSKLKIKFGDFVKSELESMIDDDAIIGDMIDNYRRLADGKQAVCYCVSRKHSAHTAERFSDAGIPAVHLDGETPKAERDRIISEFRAKRIRIICNVDLLGEGFDVPGMEAVILARPTASLTLFIQQSMRPLRPDPENPNKRAVIIDHVGNCFRHGLPNREHRWSLTAKKKKSRGAPTAKIHQCQRCYQVWDTYERTCPYCGYTPPIAERELPEVDGTLAKIDEVELKKKQRRQEVGRARSRAELERIALDRGYKLGWVTKMMQIKGIYA